MSWPVTATSSRIKTMIYRILADSDGQYVQNCCFHAKNRTLDIEIVEKSVIMLTEKKTDCKKKTVSAPFFFR